MYRWEGTTADNREWLPVIKTRPERFAAVEARVRALHSYEVPEVISLPLLAGSASYLAWILKETG